MNKVETLPQREKRQVNQRVIWIAPPAPGINSTCFSAFERRTDTDGATAAGEICRLLIHGEATGLVFGIIKADGRFEMGATGTLFDHPLLAAGIASHLGAMLDSWRDHPSLFLPVND